MPARKSKYKSISRIDAKKKNMHGWYVRVWFKGQMHSKMFSDSRYGGKEEALQEAIQWRNETEAAIGKPRTDRTVVTAKARNKSGVLGVRRAKHTTGTYDELGYPRYTEVYEAMWCSRTGKISRTGYSIAKHGETKAFQLAVAKRLKEEKRMYGQTIQDVPPDAVPLDITTN